MVQQLDLQRREDDSKPHDDLQLGEIPAGTLSIAPSVRNPRAGQTSRGETWCSSALIVMRWSRRSWNESFRFGGMTTQRSAGWIVGQNKEPMGPEAVERVGCVRVRIRGGGSGVPHTRIHGGDAAINRHKLVFGDLEVAKTETGVGSTSYREQRGVQSQGFGIHRLQERLVAKRIDLHGGVDVQGALGLRFKHLCHDL